MALILELGTPTAGAESFIDDAYITAYFDKRGYTLPVDVEKSLVQAFDFMRLLPWCESHKEPFTVTEDMKIAQCEVVYSLELDNPFTKTTVASNIKRIKEKLSVIEDEIEYFEGKNESISIRSVLENMPKVKALLGDLICDVSTANFLMVV